MTQIYVGSSSKNPSAHIAVNRNRLKHYSNRVYLKDQTNFEIELFNPKHHKVLAKIKINGQYISNAGMVVNPGQRIFLDRWIDDAKKLHFETYEIENSKEALEAISKNGEVIVEFYHESQYAQPTYPIITTYPGVPNWGGGLGQNIVYGGTTINTCFNMSSDIPTHDSFTYSTNSIETGRAEMGEASNQKFSQDNSAYDFLKSSSIVINLLPESVKPVEAREIRNYCHSCGARVKATSWKFCPQCGTKF